MNTIQKIALVFTIIGGLNWGLVGIFNFDLVKFIFGDMTFVTRAIFTIVGICAIINIAIFSVDLDRDHV